MASISLSKKIMLRGDVHDVWEKVTHVNTYDWRTDVLRIDLVSGSRFTEYDTTEHVTEFHITDYEIEESLDLEFENEDWYGHCAMYFEADDRYTALLVELDVNSRKMTFAPLFKSEMEKRMNQYLADLKYEF